MTPVEWIGMVTGVVGTLTGGTALGRLLVTHGADRERLRVHEAWIKSNGVEKVELQNLTRRVEDAEKDCVPRREFDQLTNRVHDVEGEVTEVSRLLSDIRVQIGRIPDQLSAQKEMIEIRFENTNHKINGVKHILENLHRIAPDPHAS